MNKLFDGIKKLKESWKALSNVKKIVFAILFIGLIAAIIFGVSVGTSTKYGILFSNMDPSDSATIIEKLKSDKISYKADASTNTIYVPQEKVNELRLEMATMIKSGSVGFELFDNNSQFGMTDDEFKVKYQRALSGDIERTIKSFSEVEAAKVLLVMPEDTVFLKDASPGKASVYLKLKPGQTLSKTQVKAIVSLVSGAVKNLPLENIQVVDDKMNLLSNDIKNDGNNVADTSQNRIDFKKKTESDYEKKILDLLEPVYGKGKVKVEVNAELDFDSNEQTSTVVKDPVTVSEHGIKDTNVNNTLNTGSPNDNNNSSNQITSQNNTGSNSSHEETTKNYDTSKIETKTVKSPGDIKRLSVSVVLDNNKVDQNVQASVTNVVSSAVGFDTQRGDVVSVEGMSFDKTQQNENQKIIDQMNQEAKQEKQAKLFKEIGIIAVSIITLIVLFVVLRKKRNDRTDIEEQNLDVVIDDTIAPKEKQPVKYEPIDFEEENEKSHVEKEIRKYASTKPEQVADVVKAWLAEDER